MQASPTIRQQLIDRLADDEEIIFADGLDEAILGIVTTFGQPPRVCYDLEKVLDCLQRQGMTDQEAFEYWEYNIAGAYVGPSTPAFLERE